MWSDKISAVNLLWSHFSQESFEVAAFEQFKDDVVRPCVETDADQLDDVCVVELTESAHPPHTKKTECSF